MSDSRDHPRGWPSPQEGQHEVLLLGTYHMANPGNDVVNVEADDVLGETRQRELADLRDRLAAFDPDLVAVEKPASDQQRLNERYATYRDGGLQDQRDETIQIGFRLADHLDHGRVAAVDHRGGGVVDAGDEARAVMESPPVPGDVPYPLPEVEEMQRQADERLLDSTIPEYLRWMNTEEQLRENHALMFAAGLPDDAGEPGIRMLLQWYERNLRTVRNVLTSLREADDRVLLIFGSGHVRVLRHFLDESPMFCPVSPLPYLH